MTHISQQTWYTADIGSRNWHFSNIYQSLVRCAVPVFVMISGALFLDSDKDMSVILKKNVLGTFRLFSVWAVIYFIESFLLGKSLKECVLAVIYGPLWYLLMLIGLYLLVPFLRDIARNEKKSLYYLILAIAFQFIIPAMQRLSIILFPSLETALRIIIDDVSFYFTLGYTGYFILGYMLIHRKINKKVTIFICILAGITFAVLPIIEYINAIRTGTTGASQVYGNLTIGILIESAAVFLLANRLKLQGKWIATFSGYTLGIYLIHKVVIDLLNLMGFKWDWCSTALSIPINTLIVFGIAGLFSFLIGKIVFLKRVMLR